ncbi:50S ribosomal protein L30 [Candidatus Pacearchaeota archaeon CG10_big_fil_rev_8_21_14_0_10_32_14]|nr:MAG: 50S ribosomal protein L30 [Candidatus Pacearchaeota archaeon CG10_big_fil_rev_8_21_14_0_10_32_14]
MKFMLRIKGEVGVDRDIEETMCRLKLKKKFVGVILNKETNVQMGMVQKIRNCVAYGEVSDELLEKIIASRGRALDTSKKMAEPKKVVEGLKQGKSLEDFNVKPFFRMHPPRGGFRGPASTKTHYPKGTLGDHGKELNKLVERML